MTMIDTRTPDFPANPSDGFQIKEDMPGGGYAIWTYNKTFNQWTVEVFTTPLTGYIYTDQVLTRPLQREETPELFTQQDVNYYLNDKSSPVDDEYATKQQVQALAMAVVNSVQAMESAQGVKTKGKWAHHGGPLPESGIPAESQFWMADGEGNKTQDYCDAAVVRIHAIGLSDLYRENNVLGAAEVGDLLIIQDLSDLDGCQYEITSVEFHDPVDGNYENAYAVYGVKPDETFCRGTLSPAELVSVRIKTAFSSEGGDYLPLSGGVIAGNLSVSGSLSNQGGIMMAGPKDKGFYVYDLQGGAVFSAYGDKFGAGVQYFGAVERANHVATKGYVDEQIGGIDIPEAGGGVGFTDKYNGNRYYKAGQDTTSLSEGEVMFLSGGATTGAFAGVTHVALPEAGIDWTKFTGIGTIEVRNGSTVCGYLQVVYAKQNPGRNWLVKVKLLELVSNELSPESGHPCYFWGMFTE